MSNKHTYTTLFICFLSVAGLFISCRKFTEIGPPKNGIVTAQVFSNDASANAAIAGIYTTMAAVNFGDGSTTAYLGMSADELININPGTDATQMMTNTLAVNNANVLDLWTGAYKIIAQANACLVALNDSSAQVSDSASGQFTAEAKFIRAYSYFYLVNLYGDVPLVTDNNWQEQTSMSRTPAAQVYAQIVKDLTEAQAALPPTWSSGLVIRATKWAAAALLARVNLYQTNWADAETLATTVIGQSGASLVSDPNSVFLIGSQEAIWQMQPLSYYQNTNEGTLFVNFGSPNYVLTDSLPQAFETGDLRRTDWVDSLSYNGQTLYYPYKYKANTYAPPATEYYMILRLAEQYLIRAEARAEQNNVSGAVADLNLIRERAGLSDLLATMTQPQCLLAVAQERRVELFCEWGHRWLDLVRTGRANTVLPPQKPKWVPSAALYPIPASERALDGHLTQNTGY